jgi:negative regulator of sigma-B (phosphoserine phosphatase)
MAAQPKLSTTKPLRAHTAHLCLPKPGEHENGDAVLVREDEQGRAMLAVVDALGHGPGAAQVSRAAVERLASLPLDTPVLDVMHAVHDTLRGTRGAAATVCLLAGASVEACAVGNVHLLCANCDVPLVLSPGILGHQVSRFRVTEVEVRTGARLALVSDGVSLGFRLEELRHLAPAEACQFIIERYRRQADDATVLVSDLRSR